MRRGLRPAGNSAGTAAERAGTDRDNLPSALPSPFEPAQLPAKDSRRDINKKLRKMPRKASASLKFASAKHFCGNEELDSPCITKFDELYIRRRGIHWLRDGGVMHSGRRAERADAGGQERELGPPGGELRVRVRAPRIDIDENSPTVSVVIPAMNEARNLPWLASRMPAGLAEIILVDGRSVDDTISTARSLWPSIRIVQQNRRGKGNALACGFAAATSEIVVMMDADGSMDPGEIPYFVRALVDGADYAKGSRFAPGGGSSDITWFRSAGNRVLNALTTLIHRTSYTDLCYGFNAFWRRVLPVLALEAGDGDERRWGDGFEVETLINIRVHSAGLKVTEVPSFEGARLHGSSNLRAIADGWRVLSIIAHESRALRSRVPGAVRTAAARPAVPALPHAPAPLAVPCPAAPAGVLVPAAGPDADVIGPRGPREAGREPDPATRR